MDAVQDLAEPDSAEMRQEIDSTRSAMADKLEALEDKVMGTVQSAKDTVDDSIQSAKDTVASVKRTFNIKHQIEERPWMMVGGCFLAGLAVGCLIPRGRPRSARTVADGAFAAAASTPRLQAEPLSRPSIFAPFQAEINLAKEMAIGYVMGLARDSIKDTVPQLASKIDELMNGITTKLGGEPVEQQSTETQLCKGDTP